MKTSRIAKSEQQPQARKSRKRPAQPQQKSDLADEIVAALEERGVPSGAWLVDIARARHALQEADDLLRRMEAAIIRDASSSPLDDS